ncbi:MerR family transcriptional regulator [Streptomyces sp. NRRL F-4489]|uniref:MerR family transcriptional regulator n=1 Tax=Streptomyces sp. NRRL F-4489 TaxID=1609095 RepID=UPI0007488CB5|nr:MerR family transcriptional regulator [Streptomyces sp. NRRL F-4489]KUL40408.1 MerR family transcriptional regulator [Streptomyces sp. NRRL F-4489]
MTTEQPPAAEYRIEDLAHLSGATVRTIRAYQDRGLLPRPERRGRANVYGDAHLARLRQIADLLDRGYTLASIKDLLEAWDAGRGLGGVLGLVAEIDGPWSDEEPTRLSRTELDAAFGGTPDERAVGEAVELGVLVRVPGRDDEFLVPSPQELAVAAELHSAGVPLPAISGHLREVRGQVEHIAARFLDFTTEHVFRSFLDHPPTEAETAEATALVRRLRPLAQQTIDAELARAMRSLATRYIRHHLTGALTAGSQEDRAAPAEDGTRDRRPWDQGPRDNGPGDGSGDQAPSEQAPRPADRGAGAVPDAGPGAAAAPAPEGRQGTADTPAPSGARPVADARPTPAGALSPVADPRPATGSEAVLLPATAVQAVRDLVGPENTAAFIAAAAQREVHARTMDGLAAAAAGPRAAAEAEAEAHTEGR